MELEGELADQLARKLGVLEEEVRQNANAQYKQKHTNTNTHTHTNIQFTK